LVPVVLVDHPAEKAAWLLRLLCISMEIEVKAVHQ
jgi:hypothetical protein